MLILKFLFNLQDVPSARQNYYHSWVSPLIKAFYSPTTSKAFLVYRAKIVEKPRMHINSRITKKNIDFNKRLFKYNYRRKL